MTALAALFVIAAVAGAASANRAIELIPLERTLERVREDVRALTFTETEGAASVICEVLRTVSLHRTISKVTGSLAGTVREVRVQNCTGGTVRVLVETLPWHLRFISFTGRLPFPDTIRFRRLAIAALVEAFFGLVRCLYRGDYEAIARIEVDRYIGKRFDERVSIPLAVALGGSTCPRSIIARGETVNVPPIHIRLL
ncbi:MAG: hypothetical protein WBC33_00570 [Conexibacter sp.]